MKTTPMDHQVRGAEFLAARPEYAALGAEQGTGKTYMLLADAERLYSEGRINALFVVAPRGVHINWVRREIPTHMSTPVKTLAWDGKTTKQAEKEREAHLQHTPDETGELIVFTINVDAVNQKRGERYAARFLRKYRCAFVVDESHLIKNPSSKRSGKIISLGRLAEVRRIASGTLVGNGPEDLFSQFDFLRPGLLGTTSYKTYMSEYCELVPQNAKMIRDIRAKNRYADPCIVQRDALGRPRYKNLDKLNARIAPHVFRVTKEECLDLPPKIYQTHYFELSPSHMRYYRKLRDTARHIRDTGEIDTFRAISLITKLRQVTSGYILEDGEAAELYDREAGELVDSDSKMEALVEIMATIPDEAPVIIWACYREELGRLRELLRDRAPVEYHGGTEAEAREEAIDRFQSGSARTFISNPAAGGTGITLNAAEYVIYYSCSYSLIERKQSEDRAHRIGTRKPVVYIDLAAVDTIDERIAFSLQTKEGTAAQILDGL